MKQLLILLLFLAVGLVGTVYWFNQQSRAAPPVYRYEKVDRGAIVEKVGATGRVVPRELRFVGSDIVVGKVAEIYPGTEVGQEVSEGQVLIRLDDELAKAKFQLDESAYQLAQASMQQAQAAKEKALVGKRRAESGHDQLKKALDLAKKNSDNVAKPRIEDLERQLEDASQAIAFAEAAVKEAEAGIKTAESNITKAKAGLAVAQQQLEQMVIKASTRGVILDKRVVLGQVISPQTSPVLFVIAPDLDRMQIRAMVGESDIRKVREGMPVRFTVDAYADEEEVFYGRVAKTARTPTTTTVRVGGGPGAPETNLSGPVFFEVTIDVLPATWEGWLRGRELRRLLPGLNANVDIITRPVDNALRVPNAALNYRPDTLDPDEQQRLADGGAKGLRPIWLRAADPKPRMILVHTGASEGSRTEILRVEGGSLEAGMEVVTEGPPPEKGGLFDQPSKIKF